MVALVTGATGFVGRQVVKALCSRGVEVRGLVHTPGRERVLAGESVDVHYGSTRDPAALRAAFYDVDVVIHLVAVIREKGEGHLRGGEPEGHRKRGGGGQRPRSQAFRLHECHRRG